MGREYSKDHELRQKLELGVKKLTDAVSITLGPKGRNVILRSAGGSPFITKDGVTVARHVVLSDPFEDAAATIVKQVSEKTNTDAGDGTTTSTVLANAVAREAFAKINEGFSPVEMKRSLECAAEEVLTRIEEMSTPLSSIEDIQNIASIAANNDEKIGTLVAAAVDKTGKDGAITIEESYSTETFLELVEGFRFSAGYAASAFVTDDKRSIVRYEDPIFLVTDYKINKVEQILPALEIAARESRPFIIVADEITDQALAALIMNTLRGTMKIAAIKLHTYGEQRHDNLNDLSLSTGAKFFQRGLSENLSGISVLDFGSAKTIEVTKKVATVVGGKGSRADVEQRIESLKSQVVELDVHEAEGVQKRITRLSSSVAIIKVGAATEVEMIEKKHRVEDALEAVNSARQEGVVPGGGIVLYRISEKLSSKKEPGCEVLAMALKEPLRIMSINAGVSWEEVFSKVSSSRSLSKGYNFQTGKLVDMIKAGVIDPTKVVRCAVTNAISAVGTLITTNYAIIETEHE